MTDPGDDRAIVFETTHALEALALQARLAEAGVEAEVAAPDPADPDAAASFRVLAAAKDTPAASAVLAHFQEDLEADRGESADLRPTYEAWALRSALRFALAAFLVALVLGGLARLVSCLGR